MRIYTRVVIDMTTNAILEEEYEEYQGKIAQCKGGGGDTVDEDYNRRMANIAEAQEGMAEEMFNLYKYGTISESGQLGGPGSQLGLEQAQIGFEQDKITAMQNEGLPEQQANLLGTKFDTQEQTLGVQQAKLGAQTNEDIWGQDENAFTARAGLEQQQIDTQKQGLGLQQDLYGAMGEANLPEQSVGVMSDYISEAREGVDIDERMGAAQADVAGAYQGTQAQNRKAMSRMGINPSSGRFTDQQQDMALQKARDIAGARSQARRRAEQEEFNRLQNATGLGLLGNK